MADLFRDSLILGSSKLRAIYRFPGKLLTYRPEDALFFLSAFEKHFFTERLQVQRDLLASDGIRSAMSTDDIWSDSYPYVFDWTQELEGGKHARTAVTRHRFGAVSAPVDSPDRIWQFAQKRSRWISIESLAVAFASDHPTKDWRGWCTYVEGSKLFNELDSKYFKQAS